MLYINENLELWNPATDEQEKIKLEQEESEVQQVIDEGRALEQLKGTKGFETLKTYLLQTVEDLRMRLTTETDYKKFRRFQEAAKAYNNVLVFVEYKINEGKALAEKRDPQG